ncbi:MULTISPECIES: helix-turn-helix domain-containing protein [unclassified Acidovorax]|uniref:helix-turn-helix domain-containing protein n=1 Tax=unclassified Acidovorax TaxID=2684926 RepID=UPI0025BDDB6C|nr:MULTISPECIES: helix-turn-helix domain-containing protein [unclassified Acidovorax]HQS22634.1 helix-turn-helix domain-containing protein [Acidovorax defluvii]HQS64793.1 helix-turn-helix domain-containing protein [Acidovorax defluvii]HQT19351.1 helix-turn-helix domain-containing protein [Acidovorax defluvii]HQT51389.1 helix-turn-helix domain-containing protein [Acidovorax defluvii]
MLISAPHPAADRHALIAQARQSLLSDGAAPVRAEVEPWIARSWQRCLARGLEPTRRVAFDAVSATALRLSQEQHHHLLRAARPVLEQLTRAIAGMRYFAMLTDARGIVVDVQGHCDRSDPRASAIGRVGIDLSEAAVGTTAIGAALAELQPVWLHRGEHFFDDNSSYSCAGAPLFDPQGQCVGMLDLTGVDVPERPELRHLVARSARAMEDALLLQLPHALLLRINWPGCPLGGEGDGLLTLDGDGVVVGANSMARQLVPQPLRIAGAPTHCSDLLAMPWTMLFDAARRHPAQPLDLPLWSGLRLQALALLPAPARTPIGGPTVAVARAIPGTSTVAAPLREAETALIRQAVQDARGNVAEAARALGISRATVYRKLGAPKG